MTPTSQHHPHIAFLLSRTTLPVPARAAIGFAVLVTKWNIRRRTRQQLAELDDHILRDIGVSRETARHESTLPFWHP